MYCLQAVDKKSLLACRPERMACGGSDSEQDSAEGPPLTLESVPGPVMCFKVQSDAGSHGTVRVACCRTRDVYLSRDATHPREQAVVVLNQITMIYKVYISPEPLPLPLSACLYIPSKL